MPIPAYRAKQSTNTTGTGTIVLAAAETNARSFNAAYGASSRRIMYAISWSTGFEIGLGDFDGGTPGNLTRATVLASSNAGALVTLPAGTKDVFAVFDPAAREVVSISATATLALADLGSAVVFTGSSAATLNLPAVATAPLGAGWMVMNGGTAALTIDPSGAETINGASTLVLQAGQAAMILRIASAWQAAVMIGPNVTGDLSVGGAIRMQTGTAALPAITPVGDPNTGIFSPGADQLAFSVGGYDIANVNANGLFLRAIGAEGGQLIILNPDNSTFAGTLDCGSAGNLRLFSDINNASIQLGQLSGTNGVMSYYVGSGGNHDFYGASVVRSRLASDGSRSSVIPGGSTLLPEFQCRAWVNFNGTGTVAIRASGNVSSITDNGTGDYTVNFTTPMPDANYSYSHTYSNETNVAHTVGYLDTMNANSLRVRHYNPDNSTQNSDKTFVNIAIFR